MHHYRWHIGDFASHAGHLTDMEELAYRRLLDLYYLHERPLNERSAEVARLVRMTDKQDVVDRVLSEFFVLVQGVGYTNRRADEEISNYHRKVEGASRAGVASGVSRRSEASNERSTSAERTLNQPIPIPHPPVTKNQEPPEGSGERSAEWGGGERGEEQGSLFNMLVGTTMRSEAKNRRKVISKIANDLAINGMTIPIARDLIRASRQESTSDPGGLLAHWLDSGSWVSKAAKMGHEVRPLIKARTAHS